MTEKVDQLVQILFLVEVILVELYSLIPLFTGPSVNLDVIDEFPGAGYESIDRHSVSNRVASKISRLSIMPTVEISFLKSTS